MKVRFVENKITDKIEKVVTESEVLKTGWMYKYGCKVTTYTVKSGVTGKLMSVWSDSCKVIG